MRNEITLCSARFDKKLIAYWMVSSVIGLAVTVVGIPLIPLVLLLGPGFFARRHEALECRLTERTLHVKRGVIFKSEKNVPLDKIQDIGLREGPLLRKLGLASLSIETAGQSSAQGVADASLVGVIDAPAFRDAILDQRDKVVGSREHRSAPEPAAAPQDADPRTSYGVLLEIRDSLRRIEGKLGREE